LLCRISSKLIFALAKLGGGAAECEASALAAELTALSCGNAMKLFASLLVDYIIAISRTKSAGNGIDLPINKKQAASRVKSTS
jgi:hypothetical protein